MHARCSLRHHVGFPERLPNGHVLPACSGASCGRRDKARRGEIAMRARACIILGIGAILIAAPAWAAGGRYDPDYPICMESISSEGTRIDCEYTSIETCRQGVLGGSSGTCFNNPYYVAPPPEPVTAPQPEPPPVKPAKSPKSAKSAKSAKSLQSPPSPQPAQSQQR